MHWNDLQDACRVASWMYVLLPGGPHGPIHEEPTTPGLPGGPTNSKSGGSDAQVRLSGATLRLAILSASLNTWQRSCISTRWQRSTTVIGHRRSTRNREKDQRRSPPNKVCCIPRTLRFLSSFSLRRRFFSPGSHKWQNLHSTPLPQPLM